MSPRLEREYLKDGSFIELSLDIIDPDFWRPHGFRYRLAWIQNGECRILFDNHHGKTDHVHIEDMEYSYHFEGVHQLIADFLSEIKKLGGPV